MSLTMTTKKLNKMTINILRQDRKVVSANAEILGSDGETVYKVRVFKSNHNCECKDWEMRGHLEDRQKFGCKHIKAVRKALGGLLSKVKSVEGKTKKTANHFVNSDKVAGQEKIPVQKKAAHLITPKRVLGSRIQFGPQ